MEVLANKPSWSTERVMSRQILISAKNSLERDILRANTSFHSSSPTHSSLQHSSTLALSLQHPHSHCLAASTLVYVAMRGSIKTTAGDLIVEPIEEAVALYDDLLNALHKSRVSDFVGDSTVRSSSCLQLTLFFRTLADPSLENLVPSSSLCSLSTTASK
jgi:hypothetical protein